MDWSPDPRLQLRMGASILFLTLTGCVIAVATGIGMALALGFALSFVASPSTLATPLITACVVGFSAFGVITAIVWGEREAPAHAVAAIGADQIGDGTHPTLSRRVTAVCQQADAPQPAIYVAPSDSPFSLTTGFTSASARLVVSEGLLDLLDEEELKAVVAHEIAHLKNRDIAVMTATALPVGAARRVIDLLSGPTTGVEHGMSSRADYADALITVGLLIALPLWLCTQLVAASLSRQREFAADRGAVAITGRPAALATALRSIETSLSEHSSAGIEVAGLAAFAIVEPDRAEQRGTTSTIRRRLTHPFATHPQIERRLTRLETMERTQERS